MVIKILNILGNILLRPFREHFVFLIIFFILATSCYIIRHLVIEINLIAAFTTAIHCFNISYIVTLLIGLIRPNALRNTVQGVLIAFAAIDFALNFYCICQLKYFFDADIALLILETDSNEAREFVSAMIPKWIVLTEIAIYLFVLFLWWLSTRSNFNLGKKTSIMALGLIVLCIAVNLYCWNVWRDGPIARFSEIPQYDIPSDLNTYYSHPQLSFKENNHFPDNVVVIIGESFARNHSSLYGYDKLTNPRLTELKNNSSLYTFDSISSPAPTTAISIRDMLSIFNQSDESNKEKKWYEYPSLIELMQVCGYDCYWFGNQACANKNNGTARSFAYACDRRWFLQKEGVEETNDRYDIILVDTSYQYIKMLSREKNHFIIYHMLGSHFNYRMRYPKEFAIFTENDYQKDPQSHREILSSYDNSILYNDYVVGRIINMFKETESVIIYLPDHGQVMYRNSNNPDYYAHGRDNDPLSYALGIDIPFFVYASPLYQQKHPEMMERIKYRQDNPKTWNSDNLPYFIMDLIGVKEINGENIKSKSVLN